LSVFLVGFWAALPESVLLESVTVGVVDPFGPQPLLKITRKKTATTMQAKMRTIAPL